MKTLDFHFGGLSLQWLASSCRQGLHWEQHLGSAAVSPTAL